MHSENFDILNLLKQLNENINEDLNKNDSKNKENLIKNELISSNFNRNSFEGIGNNLSNQEDLLEKIKGIMNVPVNLPLNNNISEINGNGGSWNLQNFPFLNNNANSLKQILNMNFEEDIKDSRKKENN